MDMEYYARAVLACGLVQTLVPEKLAAWRFHADSKTIKSGIAWGFRQDEIRIAERYAPRLPDAERSQLEKELQRERRMLVPREAMYLLQCRQKLKAFGKLAKGLLRYPDLACNRPWLGALRRTMSLQKGGL